MKSLHDRNKAKRLSTWLNLHPPQVEQLVFVWGSIYIQYFAIICVRIWTTCYTVKVAKISILRCQNSDNAKNDWGKLSYQNI